MSKETKDKRNIFVKIYDWFCSLFFVRGIKCLNCGKDLEQEKDVEFCDECFTKLPFIDENKVCLKCGCPTMGEAKYCLLCKETKRQFKVAASVFKYDGAIRKLIINFKFNNRPYIKNTFAHLMYEKFKRLGWDIDVVTFVPATKKKIKKRGYNQAEILCRAFCEVANLPCVEALAKTVDTKSQVELTFKQRQENLTKSFEVTDKNLVKGKNVLLIDDVYTTGATANACSELLYKAKCNNVYVFTLAHTVLDFPATKSDK